MESLLGCSRADLLRGVFLGTGVSLDEGFAADELEKAASEAGNGMECAEQT